MELIKNLFPVLTMGAVVLLAMMLRLDSLPEFFLLYSLVLLTVMLGAVLFILG
ncbi:MAG: hypothetical protein JSV52_08635 [Candidatus Zixiibacteriota bacterium]|nr:MAG: hypothetical protein JSV52_08635 [candidate division Zixibacteria bacterium]